MSAGEGVRVVPDLIKAVATIAIIAMLATGALASDSPTIEQQLRDSLVGKAVMLRNFYGGREVKFDSTGALRSNNKPGPWTLDCYLEVKSLDIKRDSLRIEAQRLGVFFDHKNKRVTKTFLPNYQATITVDLPKTREFATVSAILGRIFLTNSEPIEQMVPSEWRWFLQNPFAAYTGGPAVSKPEPKYVEAQPTGQRVERPASDRPRDPDLVLPDGTPVFRALGQATPIFKVKPGDVSPPIPVSTPDPDYPHPAREMKVEGTTVLRMVVDQNGDVADVVVQSPFGLGLDEAAVDRVRTWKFHPAKREGQPVAVMINVQVNFRLFR